jgi:purine-nucleoside phosphorylase
MPEIEKTIWKKANLALILGSGLACNLPFVKTQTVPYSNIPGFPQTHVQGHKGTLTLGELSDGLKVLIFAGRFHLYEGHSAETVQTIVRLINQLGIKNLLVTNAAGGINKDLEVADLMLIDGVRDYQNDGNLQGERGLLACLTKEPLIVKSKLSDFLQDKTYLKCGNYAAVLGPNYETLSEIELFRAQGCSAVGMSTYLELKLALELGLNVAGVSVITNSWNLSGHPTHEEVLVSSQMAQKKLDEVFERVVVHTR